MGRGALAKVRSKHDRVKKKKERDKRLAVAAGEKRKSAGGTA